MTLGEVPGVKQALFPGLQIGLDRGQERARMAVTLPRMDTARRGREGPRRLPSLTPPALRFPFYP